MSNEPFTQYLTDQLEEIERVWSLEPARFQQIRRAVQREINLAESLISEVDHSAKLLSDPGEARQRLLNALDTAERFLTNARYEHQITTNQIKDCARFVGLEEVNQRKGRCKAMAQAEAEKLWAADHDQEIRLSDMCQHVWNGMLDEHRDYLPNIADGMKSWLRSVAPPYAKKPGRPKK